MKREIKFRVWDVGLKEMIPVYDIQFHDPVTRHIDGISQKPKTTQPTIINKRTTWRQVHEEDAVLMQFTGLTDKTGKDIYEGDVVGGYPHATVQVVWDEEWAQFACLDADEAQHYGLFANSLDGCKDSWEVIGNIYENPELIPAKP